MTRSKLLVIGLDGATLDLIMPWAESGVLQDFAGWIKRGSYGRSRSVPNTDTAPAWATFATGLNPANHGLFNELGWSPDRRTLRPVQGADRQGEAFWELASRAGRRVIVCNVPFTYPAQPLHGVMIAGIDSPGETAADFCYPTDFLSSITGYRIDSQIQAAIKENRPDAGLADARAVAASRTDAVLHAMTRCEWDLAVVVYSIPDVMQHFFWRQMLTDSGPQRHAIRDGHVFIEGEIMRLLAAAGPDTILLLLSDHGFGPICATPQHLANWLAEQGFLQYIRPDQRPWRQQITVGLYDRLRHVLSESQKDRLRRLLPGLRNRVESDVRFAGIDWSHTVAFAGPSSWEIWINRRGREPQGVVADGAAYEEICGKIREALLAWRDPATGLPRVQAVVRAADVYRGRYQPLAPDLTIEWNPQAAPPPENLAGNASRFDGDHQPEGMFMAAGPGIRSGLCLPPIRLADIAPTILHLLEVAAPAEVDGRILTEILG